MALHISFKAGDIQAMNAGRYFQQEANTVVNTILDAASPRNYFVDPGNAPNIPFRFWSTMTLNDRDLTALALLVDRMEDEIARLVEEPGEAAITAVFERWAHVPWPASTFFLERLGAQQPFGPNEEVRTSIAVVDRDITLISAPRFILFRIDHHLHGAAIAQHGSYLLEQDGTQHVVELHSPHPGQG